MSWTSIGSVTDYHTPVSGVSSINVTIPAGTTNDVLVVATQFRSTSKTITGLSGGGVTTWTHALGPFVDSSVTLETFDIWVGVITGSGTTLTFNFSANLASEALDLLIFTFRSSNTGTPVPVVEASNSVSNNTTTTVTCPNLTSVNGGELYFATSWGNGSPSGGTSGFSSFTDNDGDYGGFYNTNLASSTSYAPTFTESSNGWAVSAIILDDGLSMPSVGPYTYDPSRVPNRFVGPPALRRQFHHVPSLDVGTVVIGDSGTGPLLFSGSGTAVEIDSDTGSGPLAFNGSGTATETDSDTGTSALVFGGSATANFQDPSDAYRPVRLSSKHVGPVALRNVFVPSYVAYEQNNASGLTATGSLSFNGSGTATEIDNASGTGALDLEGSGTASFSNPGGAGWTHIGTDQLAAGNITGSSFTHTTAVGTVNDLRLFALLIEKSTSVSISSLSGGGVTTWTKAEGPYTSPSGYSMELWYGPITGTGTTLTVTLSASLSSAFCDRYQIDFRSNNAGPYTFTVKDHNGISASVATDCPFPSLMSVNSGELYFGLEWTSRTAVNGSSSGFVYNQDSGGNPYIWNLDLAGSTAYQPDETQSPASSYFAIGAIFDDGSNTGVNASGSGVLSLTGAATVGVTENASGSGALSFAGSAVTLETDSASGTGALDLEGSATATFAYVPIGMGQMTLHGSGTATTSTSTVSGNGVLVLSGSGTATETDSDSGTSALVLSGSGTAAETDADSGTGALAFSGSMTAVLLYIVHGAPQASNITFTGLGTATEADHGSGHGPLAFNGSGVATTSNTAQTMGSGSMSFSATGSAAILNISPDPLHIRVGDYGIVYSVLLKDQNGQPLSLSGATSVQLHVGNGIHGLVLNVPATSFYASGHVTYTINANDLPYPGYFRAEWVVTMSGGGKKSSSVTGYGLIIVHEALTLGPASP